MTLEKNSDVRISSYAQMYGPASDNRMMSFPFAAFIHSLILFEHTILSLPLALLLCSFPYSNRAGQI